MSNIQATKYLANRFNFKVNARTTALKTVAEIEAEDEAKLVKRWAFAIKDQREKSHLDSRLAAVRSELKTDDLDSSGMS